MVQGLRNSVLSYSQLKFKDGGNNHSFIARVRTVNEGKLPLRSPQAVSRLFAAHADMKAVGLNWKTERPGVVLPK